MSLQWIVILSDLTLSEVEGEGVEGSAVAVSSSIGSSSYPYQAIGADIVSALRDLCLQTALPAATPDAHAH
jgi:hypothetical protein